jgi:hypothetical protein
MIKPNGQAHYERCEEVDLRQLDGEAFFVSGVTNSVHHLNPLAIALLRSLNQPRTLAEISAI